MVAHNLAHLAGSSRAAGITLTCLVTFLVCAVELGYADCPVPGQYPHFTSVAAGDLTFTVASDQSDYAVGEEVQMFLSVENTGSNPVVIPNPCGCHPLEAFAIFPEACPTPLPPSCGRAPFWYPSAHFFFGTPITVAPGQCLTYTRAWGGTPVLGGTTSPGAYVVAAGMSESEGSFYLPQAGVRLPIQIGEPSVAIRTGTWGRMKLIYR